MKDKGSQKGKSRKVEGSAATPAAGSEAKAPTTKAAPLTAKEKIAANQKNKRRR